MTDKFDTLILTGSFDKTINFLTYGHDSKYGKFTYFYYRKDYGFPEDPQWFWKWNILDAHWKDGDPILRKTYDKIREMSKSHKILLHGQGDMMHPEFIRTLSKRFGGHIFTIFCIDGEPASSPYLSHPVVYAYDYATTCGLYFDDKGHTCAEKLLEKGALGASWINEGTKYHKHEEVWNYPIDSGRDIDVIFLGATRYAGDETREYPPPDLNIYAIPKYTVCKYLKDRGINIHYEPWQNEAKTKDFYKRAKIGINLHGASPFGIGSSQRLWDLAASGVMVITDGKEYGIENIFIPGKECATFSWKNLDEAVELIKYYLAHDSERIEIAKNARDRTYREYRNDEDDSYLLRILESAISFWKSKGMWNAK